MIKFKAKHLRDSGYSLHIPGNSGEEEMIIVTSWGQDRRSRLVIITAQCDGSVTVVHNGNARVPVSQAITTVDNCIKKWQYGSSRSVKPTAEEVAWLDKQRDKVVVKIDQKWGGIKTLDFSKKKVRKAYDAEQKAKAA